MFLFGHVPLVGAYACAAGAVPGAAGLLGCLLLLGVYYAATDGVLAAAAAAGAPADLRGSGLALAQTAVAAGRFVAALGFGAAWMWVGYRSARSAAPPSPWCSSCRSAALLLREGPRPTVGTTR